MGSLPVYALVAIFVLTAAAVWAAGVRLSDSTDVLATRLHLGEAFGGLIVLAIATNLPEIAITASAALANDLGIAVGNILGGIAIQTVVLALLDVVGVGAAAPLMYRAASLTIALEALLVIAVLVVVVAGSQLPASVTVARLDPGAVVIVALWGAGLWLIGLSRRGLPWHEQGHPPDGQSLPRGHAEQRKADRAAKRGHSTRRVAGVFGAAAVVTLVGGIVLERSGERIAAHVGVSGVLFGATALAAATALPEVSTGLAAIRLGDYQLAVADIFGGNAFLPVLFLLASLLSGRAVLPRAHDTDIYLTALGMLLTAIYVGGMIFRPRRQVLRMGLDSAAVVVVYAVGLVGLFAVASK